MILALKTYFAKHKLVSTRQLSKEFMTTSLALEPMLQHWLNKGLIKPYQPCNSCSMACGGCSSPLDHWYQWVDLSKNVSAADV